ncbi:MAG TPA: hypothetical protein VF868_06735 [Bacteroidia bacterium]|jgi:hypothetical protein
MKRLFFLFLLISSTAAAQTLTLRKATMQTLNHGASPTSSTTYNILVCNCKKGSWSIDSVISVSSGQSVNFTLFKTDDPKVPSRKYRKIESLSGLGTGDYQITFSVTKNRGSGRPGAPQNTKADTTNIDGGVIIYYSMKKNKGQMKIDAFEELERIDAP